MTQHTEAEPLPEIPSWRRHAREAVAPYQTGLDLLGSSLDFARERLTGAEVTAKGFATGEGRSTVLLLTARTIGTADAIHALLGVGRVEQAEMLVRTLVDAQADAHLLASRPDAFGFYADWVRVEQARQALQLREDEIIQPGRDLAARRAELADGFVARLAEWDPEAAAGLKDHPLEEVLEGFCRSRYGSRRPSSWRQGYTNRAGLSSDQLRELIIVKAAEAAQLEGVPTSVRDQFQQLLDRELALLFGHLSGEIHNSPLTMNLLVDPQTLAIRLDGNVPALPRALAASFLHLLRMMCLFDFVWGQPPVAAEWSSRAMALSDWMDGLRDGA
jgi:hypothetical protein